MNLRKISLLFLPMLFVLYGFYLKEQDKGDGLLIRAVTQSLRHLHYDPVDLDNDFSKKAFALYIEALDPSKRLFTASDMEKLKRYEKKIDDETREGTYTFFDISQQIYRERIDLTESYFRGILSKPFNYEIKEQAVFGDDDQEYAADENELHDRWRTYLKYNVLSRVYTDLEEQAQRKDSGFVPLSFDSLEHKVRNRVLNTHIDWYKRLRRMDRKDAISLYVNSLTAVYDPHTNYFPPKDKENFDIQMSGKLEGIGATLQEKEGYITVTSVVPGGPASLQGELKKNDKILKVMQEGEEPVDIVDWAIDDAVKIIRGKKGSKVTLTVRKPDGSISSIEIVRDVVILEETYAKSLVINDQDNVSTGYIYLPSFYADFGNRNGRFSWKDVKKEVEKLSEEGVSGIVLDLRNNGGGSLDDVVQIAGLFIDQGPVVQIKEKNRGAAVLYDERPGTEWDGALVIMVNEFSASASEIMAAAMQDYERAVILGPEHTHGKGTVQRFHDLNRSIRSKFAPTLGHVKLTTQKFYRINGDATQLKGVRSDVLVPDYYMYLETGEKEHAHPLEWDQIQAAAYKPTRSVPAGVIPNSRERIKDDSTFAMIEENAQRWKKQQEARSYPLRWMDYQAYQTRLEKEDEYFSQLLKDTIPGFVVDNVESDKDWISKDRSRTKRNEDWISGIKKDPYIYEALQIIEDWNNQALSEAHSTPPPADVDPSQD